ncbi:metal ABC transporter ATP-binding protein [Erysipelothrix sp. HDW6B]|uniref:metal ABC transporter ATP-binding protein n=1 Tax=Erysipelothrix sp. HDW6B TaxID=2714929 RepID=UPI00140CD6BC|nr:metal ABC transporter ATP-binding protein [Erysipelothrix sp. HDW6B]QIK86118.1 metal ABC transporter ATP-binding protein [Erysipelothrix sp. HDW6B]
MENRSVIKVRDLSFSYDKRSVLKDVSFDINQGDFLALVGANGSGKSTLMKLMLGLLTPQQGSVEIFGSNILNLKNFASIGYVPQGGLGTVSNFPATALEVVLLRIKGGNFFNFSNKKRKKQAMDALRHVGLESKANDLISNLSGGQLQRVLIARELMMNPEIMFLDEPASGLDSQSIATLFELLQHINEKHNITIVMVTHQLDQENLPINRVLTVSDYDVKEI